MHAEVQRQDLSRVLSSVAKIVQPKATVPILGNVLLHVEDGLLTARGTDLDMEVVASVGCTSHANGYACVPAHDLAGIIRKMAGDSVELRLEPGNVTDTGDLFVKAGRSRFKLRSIPHRSLPTLAGAPLTHSFTTDLAALFAPVAFAMCPDVDRPFLMGIYLHERDAALCAAATDRARLAVYSAALPAGAASMPAIIVPDRLVGILPKGDVAVRLGKTRIEIEVGSTIIRSKLIEGSFIEYERIFPTDLPLSVVFDKAEFLDAVTRVALVANAASGKAVKMSVREGGVDLAAIDSDGREANDEVAASLDGEPLRIAFNAGFLQDILTAAPGERIRIAMKDAGTRAKFTSEDDSAFAAVVGPYRTAA